MKHEGITLDDEPPVRPAINIGMEAPLFSSSSVWMNLLNGW